MPVEWLPNSFVPRQQRVQSLVVTMVRTQSYAAAFAAAASLRMAAGAEIDMTHVASSEEYLSGKVHAQSMAAKTVTLFSEFVSLQAY